jgi:membrane fusion protein, multidrug efflux system
MPRPHRPLAAPAALAALLAAASACAPDGRAAPAAPEAAVPVRTAPVDLGPVERPIRAAGTVAAKDEWDLSFQVGGRLAQVAVHEGERVRRGQVLARLDGTEIAAAVTQARAALAKAERDRARARVLAASDAIARAEADDAETAADVAQARLEAAAFTLRHATLTAPDDGWVDRRLAEPGEVVSPGRAVVHVSGRSRGFVVRASLPERDVLGLEPGAAATVRLDAAPGQAIAGRVAEIGRSAARGTGTYPVEIRLDAAGAPPTLLAGLTAKVEIARTVDGAAAVPLEAVQEGDGERGVVFVAEGGRARRVPVRIAFLKDDRAVLAAGLEGAERVITEGAARLADGARIQAVP